MRKASISGWRIAPSVYNETKMCILNVSFLWRDVLVCILLFKDFDFSKCVSALGTLFLSSRSGYTFNLGDSSNLPQTSYGAFPQKWYHRLPKSALYTLECTKDLLGTVPSTVLYTGDWSCLCVGWHLSPPRLLWSLEETFTCRKLESKNSGTWKSSKGLQNWLSPSNKSTAKTSQRLLLIICILEFKDLELTWLNVISQLPAKLLVTLHPQVL